MTSPSASPASESQGLFSFPFSTHSMLLSAYSVLGYHHKLEMVPGSKEFTTLWGKKKQVRNRKLACIHHQVQIVGLLYVRLCWTWGISVKKESRLLLS